MRLSVIVLLAASLAACAGAPTRIKHNQGLFDSYPPQVQELIRVGKVEVGFTMDQARMALGKPDRSITETTAGLTREVWVYGGGGPRVSLGFGMGMFGGGRTSLGSSMGVNSSDAGSGERLRLSFENGRLASIKSRSSH